MSVAPLISVVLPTHNRTALLPRSIGSVLHQTFRSLELIVVDDGSTEDIRAVLENFGDSRIRYIRREQRGGVAAARNTGIQVARGLYLAFQDSDDEWLLMKLEQQMQALADAGPDYGMTVCGLLRVGENSVRQYFPDASTLNPDLTSDAVIGHPFAYTQTWLVRRDNVLEAGRFDETLRVWDDWELLIRLSLKLRIFPMRDALVISEKRADSISAEGDRFLHDISCILAKHSEYLHSRPKQLGQLEYISARLLGSTGQLPETRRALLRSLRQRPTHWKSAALLALSFGGPTLLKRVLNPAPSLHRSHT